MSLKLFRSTGFSSILTAGETRVPMHPGWMILATSMWVGFASNGALWQQLRAPGSSSPGHALAFGAFVAAACAVVLSILGWRKTLKPAATVILFLAALGVCATWGGAAPTDGSLAGLAISSLHLPSWNGLLQWQAWAILAGLAVLPAIWVCKTRVRRLSGQQQLSVNLTGIFAAGSALALCAFLVFDGL
jgi:glucan phosphoethanolaminetransferase (alkaline phosphatase superfamily)